MRVSLADKLYNARSILTDCRILGDDLWHRFNAGAHDQLWYYTSLAAEFDRLYPERMASELGEVVEELRSAVERRKGRAE